MQIVVVGTGYVGLVTGACLADSGATVTCVDTDTSKIRTLLDGRLPIHEPGLGEVVQRGVANGRLRFTTELSECIGHADAVFIAVGTPSAEDGSSDLRYVEAVARDIGEHLTDYTVVVTKSTVPVGTTRRVRQIVSVELVRRGCVIDFDVASNPEFLKEGVAVADFMKPDRIVIGVDNPRARRVLERLYRPFVLNGHPVMVMDIASAEITKYAANGMLAIRVSFMNLMAQLCEVHGADVGSVRRALGADNAYRVAVPVCGCRLRRFVFPEGCACARCPPAKRSVCRWICCTQLRRSTNARSWCSSTGSRGCSARSWA